MRRPRFRRVPSAAAAPATCWLPRSPDCHGRAVLSGGIYSLDRIVSAPVPLHDVGMPLPAVSEASKRPADDALYDRRCDLVEAAIAIRRLADDPAAGRALPALLGCIEAELHELGCAVASFDETSDRTMPTEAMADRINRGFMNLGLTLADADLASTAARGLAGHSVAPTSRGRSGRDTRLERPRGPLPGTDDSSRRR